MCLISRNRKKKYFLLQISLKLGCDFTAWSCLILSVAHEYGTGVTGCRNVESQAEVQMQLDLEMVVITLTACLK